DEVLVLHGEHRQLEAHHAPDLARPQAAGIDHVLGVHAAGPGDYVPGAAAALGRVRDAGVARHLGAADLRRLGVGVGDAVGGDEKQYGVEQRADEVFLVQEG